MMKEKRLKVSIYHSSLFVEVRTCQRLFSFPGTICLINNWKFTDLRSIANWESGMKNKNVITGIRIGSYHRNTSIFSPCNTKVCISLLC